MSTVLSVEGKKITDLTAAEELNDTDLLIIHDGDGMKTITAKEFRAAVDVLADAGYHNSIYRGKDLTDVYTVSELAVKVAAEDWDDLYIGDYITVSITTDLGGTEEVDLMIGGFNFFLNNGDTALTTPHLLMLPKDCFATTSYMNDSSTTEGGYASSYMHTTVLPIYADALSEALDGHVLTHRRLLSTTMSTSYDAMGGAGRTGAASAWSWSDTDLALMTEPMVFGTTAWSSSGYDIGDGQMQIPLFAARPDLKIAHLGKDGSSRYSWWLSAVASSPSFAYCASNGNASLLSASYSYGVRPYFLFG